MRHKLFDGVMAVSGAMNFYTQAFELPENANRVYVWLGPHGFNITDMDIEIVPEIRNDDLQRLYGPTGEPWDPWLGGTDFQATDDQRLIYAKSVASSQPNDCSAGNTTWFEFEAPLAGIFRLKIATSAAGNLLAFIRCGD